MTAGVRVVIHVLFIGNSLVYANDLPSTLEGLARATGDTIQTSSVSLPNFAVIDHAVGRSNAADLIKRGGWDFVILQQGPTSQPLSRDTLILATRIFDPLVRAAGGRTALLMTWPAANAQSYFEAVRETYRLAAQAVGGVFLPAGEAWRAALAEDPTLPLYGPDGYHPAPLGTFLVALVLYEQITGRNPQSLPAQAIVAGRHLGVPAARVRLLQRVAHETVSRFAAAGSPH